MSSWAPKLMENVRTARDRGIEQLNGLARQVQGGFDDLRSRAWEFDLDTHPMDRIDAAMTWAEALVRRVILSWVAELREEISDHERRFPRRWEPMLRPENAEQSQLRFPSSRESAALVGESEQNSTVIPHALQQSSPEHASCEAPLHGSNENSGAAQMRDLNHSGSRVRSASLSCCAAPGIQTNATSNRTREAAVRAG